MSREQKMQGVQPSVEGRMRSPMMAKCLWLLMAMLVCLSMVLTSHAAPRLDLSAKTQSGERVFLESYKGKVVYVDFWASWCAPCRDSFPWMELMHQRYGDKGLAIVAINLDEESEMAGPFLADFNTSFDILYDPKGEVAGHFNLQGMPSSYLFDRDGHLVSEHLGFFKSKQVAVEQEIQSLLKKRSADAN
ncbi:TlpA disulfide reductase family protein [Shewanella aegiceratis]|uniref:TlpA disulfide reductase family protein n=1 Tax=Shewanella aegiceratis TaxID=2864203 RepID=UPI001C65D7FB|nr:TlpA disulfide reductase family protein [Shewanella aegiceratis]QYJ84217.1 TlpA family protein disulfide reductase [Shewanella aegiceratis]